MRALTDCRTDPGCPAKVALRHPDIRRLKQIHAMVRVARNFQSSPSRSHALACGKDAGVRGRAILRLTVKFVGAIGRYLQHPVSGLDRKLPGADQIGIEVGGILPTSGPLTVQPIATCASSGASMMPRPAFLWR